MSGVFHNAAVNVALKYQVIFSIAPLKNYHNSDRNSSHPNVLAHRRF